MKHVKRQTGEQFVYSFSIDQVIDMLINALRKEHWEIPHIDDTADRQLVEKLDHYELVLTKKLKDQAETTPLRKLGETEAEPAMIDPSKLNTEELLELAIRAESKRKQPESKPTIPLVREQSRATAKEYGYQTDAIRKLAKGFTREFSMREIKEALGLSRNENIFFILDQMVKEGLLKKRKDGDYLAAPVFYRRA